MQHLLSTVLSTIHAISHNHHNNPKGWGLLVSLFYKWGSWGLERSGNLCMVTESVRDKTKSSTRSHVFNHYLIASPMICSNHFPVSILSRFFYPVNPLPYNTLSKELFFFISYQLKCVSLTFSLKGAGGGWRGPVLFSFVLPTK